jgi:flagellar protein FliO/FliZ
MKRWTMHDRHEISCVSWFLAFARRMLQIQKPPLIVWASLIGLLLSQTLRAADASGNPIGANVSPLAATSLLSTVSGLILVLAVIFIGAWLFKRYSHLAISGKGIVRVLGGASVGNRERVVVVEVEQARLVLGVAPGQVRILYVLNPAEAPFGQHLEKAVSQSDSIKETQRAMS